jgi:hypothetical protein
MLLCTEIIIDCTGLTCIFHYKRFKFSKHFNILHFCFPPPWLLLLLCVDLFDSVHWFFYVSFIKVRFFVEFSYCFFRCL